MNIMESEITSLINNLSKINLLLKENNTPIKLINNPLLINELSEFLDTLIKQDSYSSFEICYLHLLLGKNLNITKVVDLLSKNLSSLDNIKNLNEGIINTLTGNIKGRLRKLSNKDSISTALTSTLNRLNNPLPSDLKNKYQDVITFKTYTDSNWKDICYIFEQANLIELEGCCDLRASVPLESYKQSERLKNEFTKICAYHNNKIIGYIAYSIRDLSITSLYILPEYMGKHIGKTLLQIALINLGVNIKLNLHSNYVIDEGILNPLYNSLFIGKRTIHVICMTNNIKALNLYKSFGFIPRNMYMDILNGYKCMYTNMYKEL